MPRAFFLATVAGLVAGAHATFAADASGGSALRAATWGGAYGAAQIADVIKPFTSRTGIPIVPTLTGVDLPTLSHMDAKSKPDLVDLPALEAAEACAKGLLAPLDPKSLPPGTNGLSARDDFFVQPDACSVPASLMGDVVLYDRNQLKTNTPQHISDFFDTKKIPGKRALKRDVVGLLEWALIADNVPPSDVYKALATPDGLDRAFAKLDKIRNDIVWWNNGARAVELVTRGEVVMAQAYIARAYEALNTGATSLGVLWDRALVTTNRWAVVRGSEGKPGAREFLSFATEPARMTAVANEIPYAPARRSAVRQLAPEMVAFSVASPERISEAFPIDMNFWTVHELALRQRFETWLAAARH